MTDNEMHFPRPAVRNQSPLNFPLLTTTPLWQMAFLSPSTTQYGGGGLPSSLRQLSILLRAGTNRPVEIENDIGTELRPGMELGSRVALSRQLLARKGYSNVEQHRRRWSRGHCIALHCNTS